MTEGDSFKIVRCGVENSYNKETKTTYTNFIVFEIEASEPKAEAEDNPFIEK